MSGPSGPVTRAGSVSRGGKSTAAQSTPKEVVEDSSSLPTECRVTKEEIDLLVTNAVKLATDLYERKLESLREHIDSQNKIISDLKKRVIRNESEINNLNQYSRRSHLRIYGYELKRNSESCKKQVVALFNSMKDSQNSPLVVTEADIDDAHTLPQKPPSQQSSGSQDARVAQKKPPCIIVRFFARELRDSILINRKSLKGRRIGLQDDLTPWNAKLLRDLQDSPNFKSAWSWQGRIYATTLDDHTKKMNAHDFYQDM